MAWNKNGYIAALSLAFIFAACGGDSGNNATTSEITEALSSNSKSSQSTDDVKSCKDDPFFSTWEGCYCEDGTWVCDLSTSSSSTLISSSSSCANCVMDRSSSSSSDKRDSVFVSAQIVNKTISGLAQKGPFDVGSVISLYQLDGKTFVQKENTYTSKVADANGAFEISNISQSSPYASIQVNGSYRSEITGKFSNGKITLKSFADLSNRSYININMLTHLTNNRIAYLASTGVSVSEAKKRAESEILKIFNVKDDVKNFENLNLFGKNSGNAVLLTISVLMQRDLNVTDINSLLSEFEKDFEEDGIWNDETAKAKIADWASAKDLAGGLDTIRNNIEKWKLGTVPSFEKYVRNYWYASYGLGECSKSREGEVLADTNKFSSNYEKKVRYICKDTAWRKASYFEMDTYKWEKGEDGEMKKGNVTGRKYIYDAEQETWRDPSAEEEGFGGCTLERENDIAQFSNVSIRYWYICKSRKWVVADTIEVDTRGWAEGADGEIKKGDSTSIFYKYDEVPKKWLTTNKNDTTLKLDGCTTKREGEIQKSSVDNEKYICRKLEWKLAQEIDLDTYGEKCTSQEIGRRINGSINETRVYYCSANGWVYITIDWSWDVPKEARLNSDFSYGAVTDARDGKTYKTVKIGAQVWMAENLNYADTLKTPSLKGKIACNQGKEEHCDVAGRLYRWSAAAMKSYTSCSGGTCTIYNQGVCPKGWHVPSSDEWRTLFSTVGGTSKAAKVLKSKTGWMGDGNGSDAVGFSAIPAGGSIGFHREYSVGRGAVFWLPEEHAGNGGCIGLIFDEDGADTWVPVSASDEGDFCSIRCVQD